MTLTLMHIVKIITNLVIDPGVLIKFFFSWFIPPLFSKYNENVLTYFTLNSKTTYKL